MVFADRKQLHRSVGIMPLELVTINITASSIEVPAAEQLLYLPMEKNA